MKIESGSDIVALRRFVGLTQAQFAQAREDRGDFPFGDPLPR